MWHLCKGLVENTKKLMQKCSCHSMCRAGTKLRQFANIMRLRESVDFCTLYLRGCIVTGTMKLRTAIWIKVRIVATTNGGLIEHCKRGYAPARFVEQCSAFRLQFGGELRALRALRCDLDPNTRLGAMCMHLERKVYSKNCTAFVM